MSFYVKIDENGSLIGDPINIAAMNTDRVITGNLIPCDFRSYNPNEEFIEKVEIIDGFAYFTFSAISEQDKINKLVPVKKSLMTQMFEEELNKGFVCSNGIKMDCTISDIRNVNDGVTLAEMIGRQTLTIRDYNNVVHEDLPLSEVKQMVIDLGINYQMLMQKKWTLHKELDDAGTLVGVDGINW